MLGIKPFNFVEDPLSRKYSNLKDITTKTFMKHMDRLTKVVELKIGDKLPEKVALVRQTTNHAKRNNVEQRLENE